MTRRVCRAIAWGVLAAGLCAEPVAAGQIGGEFNAFNGYRLETPLTDYPSLQLIEHWSGDFVEEVSLYENPGESVVLNGVSFLKVRYRFADRRLESIELVYEGRENREKLLQWVEERYGKLPPEERRMIAQVLWHGDQLTITLSYNKPAKRGTLWFVSPALHERVNKSLYMPGD